MKVLLIDNYDSFTYNIAHIVKSLSPVKLEIKKALEIDISSLSLYDKIIFSPGPDLPLKGNIMEQVLEIYAPTKSILGICLGLQAIVLFYGGKLIQLDEVVHGRIKMLKQTGAESTVLRNIPEIFKAGFYHSWVSDAESLPGCLNVTCLSFEGRVMGIRHSIYDIEAVQFHPESIMTPDGDKMIINWLQSRAES